MIWYNQKSYQEPKAIVYNKFREKIEDKPENNKKVFRLKIFDVLSYIIKRYEDEIKPTSTSELAEYFNITEKQMLDYVRTLEIIEYVYRPKGIRPKTNYPTLSGMNSYYDQIINICPKGLQSIIRKYKKVMKFQY